MLERVVNRPLQDSVSLQRQQLGKRGLKSTFAGVIQPVFYEPLDHAIPRAWSP